MGEAKFGRPSEGFRPGKVAAAKRKIAQGLDRDPKAIDGTIKKLMKEIGSPGAKGKAI